MAQIEQMLDDIKGLTVLELNQLVKALEDEFGVSAAAAAPVMMAGAVPGAAGGGEAAEQHWVDQFFPGRPDVLELDFGEKEVLSVRGLSSCCIS